MDKAASKVKKISQARLQNIALWYLERFGGTRARVRHALLRRVQAAEAVHGPTPEAAGWIEEVLNTLERLGHINDAAFATSRVAKGQRQGKSRALIRQDLTRAGVAPNTIDQALDTALEDSANAELDAARTYVQRRHLGPYRSEPELHYDKDLARLARRGFSYEIARRALAED